MLQEQSISQEATMTTNSQTSPEQECSYKLAFFELGEDRLSAPKGPEMLVPVSRSALANHTDSIHTADKTALRIFTSWMTDEISKQRLWTEDWLVLFSAYYFDREEYMKRTLH